MSFTSVIRKRHGAICYWNPHNETITKKNINKPLKLVWLIMRMPWICWKKILAVLWMCGALVTTSKTDTNTCIVYALPFSIISTQQRRRISWFGTGVHTNGSYHGIKYLVKLSNDLLWCVRVRSLYVLIAQFEGLVTSFLFDSDVII